MELTNSEIIKLTHQEIFNQVYTGLSSQSFQGCIDKDSDCLYRFEHLKCAGGWLIADELYNREIEGLSIDLVPEKYLPNISRRDVNVGGIVKELQDIHDNWSVDSDGMQLRLIEYASEKGLGVPE